MKCLCGAAIRITANGVSQCWECYDARLKQNDTVAATHLAEAYKKYFGHMHCADCLNAVKHEHLCSEALFRSIWPGSMMPHFRERYCIDKCPVIS